METAIIIGITSKIGLAAARRFFKAGKRIAGIDLPSANWDAIRELFGENIFTLPMDCSDTEQIQNNKVFLLEQLTEKTVLFLCLESGGNKNRSQEENEFRLRAGAAGVLNIIQTVVPAMSQKGGHIILLSPPSEGLGCSKRCTAGIQTFLKQYIVSIRRETKGTALRLSYIDRADTEEEHAVFSFEKELGNEGKSVSPPLVKKYSPEELSELIYYLTLLPKNLNVNLVEIG